MAGRLALPDAYLSWVLGRGHLEGTANLLAGQFNQALLIAENNSGRVDFLLQLIHI